MAVLEVAPAAALAVELVAEPEAALEAGLEEVKLERLGLVEVALVAVLEAVLAVAEPEAVKLERLG